MQAALNINNIKLVLMDADGVLIKSSKLFSEKFSQKFNIPMEKILPFFKGPFQYCLRGEADLLEELPLFLKRFKDLPALSEIMELWFSGDKLDGHVISFMQKLNGKAQFVLATNNDKHRVNYLRQKFNLDELFENYASSAELGFLKTDPGYFHGIKKLYPQFQASEMLLIDDDEMNIKTALENGLHGVFYEGAQTLNSLLNTLL